MTVAKGAIRRDEQQDLGERVSSSSGVAVAAERSLRLVGLAADEDPELGFLGVLSLRDVARVCEEHQVRQARAAGWTWAQIAAALGVSPQAVHQRHGALLSSDCPSQGGRGPSH